jgi:hypothetical protein
MEFYVNKNVKFVNTLIHMNAYSVQESKINVSLIIIVIRSN